MKYIGLLLVSLFFISSCQQKEEGYLIMGSAAGFDEGTKVYVNAISQSNRPSIIDSTVIKNESFSIALPPTPSSDFNYISFSNVPGNVIYLPENQKIEMTIYKDSLRSSKVLGGAENDLFFTYVNQLNNLAKKKEKASND